MNNMKRILCILLAVLLLLPVLVACGGGDDPAGDGQQSSTGTSDVAPEDDANNSNGETEAETDKNGFLMDNLGTMDFKGKVLNVLAWEDCSYDEFEIDAEDMNAGVLQNAVYIRNLKVEGRMNLKFTYKYAKGGNDYMQEFLKEAEVLYMSDAVDAFASYSRVACSLMIRGYTADMNKLNYFDSDNPWWTRDLINKSTIYNHLYFASGDIAPSMFGMTFIIYFNKDLVDTYLSQIMEVYEAETLYDMVYDGTWTLDNMLAFCKGVGDGSLDGDLITKSADDLYGFTVSTVNEDAFYWGSGMRVLEYKEDGSVMISQDYGSAKAHTLVAKLVEFFDSPDAYCSPNYNNDFASKAWTNGNVLFHLNTIAAAPNFMNRGMRYGILPIPKYDQEQELYYEISGFPYTMWSISRNASDLDAIGAGLECMASESYRTVSPAYYDVMLREQSSDSAEDYKMWETIKHSVEIEGGRAFDQMFENKSWSIFRQALMARTGDYMSYYATHGAQLDQFAIDMNAVMAAIEDIYGG